MIKMRTLFKKEIFGIYYASERILAELLVVVINKPDTLARVLGCIADNNVISCK